MTEVLRSLLTSSSRLGSWLVARRQCIGPCRLYHHHSRPLSTNHYHLRPLSTNHYHSRLLSTSHYHLRATASVSEASARERESVGHGTPETFPSRLLSLLRAGRSQGEGVGGVREEDMEDARRGLVKVLQAVPSQPLSPEIVASTLCEHYQLLRGDVERRLALLAVLSADLAVDHSAVQHSASQLAQLHRQDRQEVTLLKSESSLRQVLTPFYAELFTHIARTEGGIKFLVDLRADILDQLRSHGDAASSYLLSEMSTQLRDLLGQWFSVGLMDMQQLTWQSPCDIMEKISEYEAVHPLRHWQDLKHRVSRSRRCFVFTHHALPRDPLVVLHAALTSEPSSSIQTLLNRSLQGEDDDNITTAVFYSISATQRGLSGIDLGYYIIRRVVEELRREFPRKLSTFVTLSPIPGFRRWLDSRVKQSLAADASEPLLPGMEGKLGELKQLFPDAKTTTHALQMALAKSDWAVDRQGPLASALKTPLSSLCAWYLVHEKRRRMALDPVAHFHLNGGAVIWRLNWLADVSPLGFQNSYGLMCNYGYGLQDLTHNSDSYRMTGEIATSDSVQKLLPIHQE